VTIARTVFSYQLQQPSNSVTLFIHGTDLQFIPHGRDGDPYYTSGVRGALGLPSAEGLFSEALERGSACSGDFSQLDHLAIAETPMIEIRREFNIPPLRKLTCGDKEIWPSTYLWVVFIE